MKTILVIAAFAALVVIMVLIIRSRLTSTYTITVEQLPQILAALSASSKTPAFAAFMFASPGQPDAVDYVNLQYSVEDSLVAFDWVLLSSQNIDDKDRFLAFARDLGYSPQMNEQNGVRYLRVGQGDLVRLVREIITGMYRIKETQPLEMIVEGFEWQPLS